MKTDNEFSGPQAEATVPDLEMGTAAVLRALSPADWARFGAGQIAYVRPAMVQGQQAIAIHAADGTPIGAAPDLDLALAAIRQHEMEPALLQ